MDCNVTYNAFSNQKKLIRSEIMGQNTNTDNNHIRKVDKVDLDDSQKGFKDKRKYRGLQSVTEEIKRDLIVISTGYFLSHHEILKFYVNKTISPLST